MIVTNFWTTLNVIIDKELDENVKIPSNQVERKDRISEKQKAYFTI